MEVTRDFVTVVAVEGASVEEFVTVLSVGCEAPDGAEDVLVYRLPGERLGFGLKFEGGTSTSEKVRRLFIQSCAPDSPASRARCSWGSLQEGDEVLEIDSVPVTAMTRLDCVRSLKDSHVVLKLLVRHPAPPPIPPRRKTQSAGVLGPPTAFADVPPEPEVYLDLLAQEELNCLTDTGSDDTGSSISTVLGPFDQLEEDTLQPPVNFQDAPLTYGDETLQPPKPAPRKDIQGRFRSGKKRPPPPPPPRNDRPQCPLNVQTIAVVETDRGDLPRLVDVVPKSFLETEEVQDAFAEEAGPVITDWEEHKLVVTENGPIVVDGKEKVSREVPSRTVVRGEERNVSQSKEGTLVLAGNEAGLSEAACEEDSVRIETEKKSVDPDILPIRSENEDRKPVERDGNILVDIQGVGFLGKENEEYQSVGKQNQKSVCTVLDMEDRPASTESEDRKFMERPARAENEVSMIATVDTQDNKPLGVDGKHNRHVEMAEFSTDNMSVGTVSGGNSTVVTRNKENIFAVMGNKGSKSAGTDFQEYRLTETSMKENSPLITDSNGNTPMVNGSKGSAPEVTHPEEKWSTGINNDGKLLHVADIGEHVSDATCIDRGVALSVIPMCMEENRPVITGIKEKRPVETRIKENWPLETGIKETRAVETGILESWPVETGIKGRRPKESGIKDNWPAEMRMKETGPVETGVKEKGFVEMGIKENWPVDKGIKENGPVEKKIKEKRSVETEIKENWHVERGIKEMGSVEKEGKENWPVEMGIKEKGPLETEIKENGLVETGIEEKGYVETAVKEGGSVETRIKEIWLLEKEEGSVEMGIAEKGPLESEIKEEEPVDTGVNEKLHVETGIKGKMPLEKDIKEDMHLEQGVQENRHVDAEIENYIPVGGNSMENNLVLTKNTDKRSGVSDSKENGSRVIKNKVIKSVENSPVAKANTKNRPVETNRSVNAVLVSSSKEDSPLVSQSAENNATVAKNMESDSLGEHQSKETNLVGLDSFAGTCNKGNIPVVRENKTNSPVVSTGKKTISAVTKSLDSSPPGTIIKEHNSEVIRRKENISVVTENQEIRPVNTTNVEAKRKEYMAHSRENSPVDCDSVMTTSEESKEHINTTEIKTVETERHADTESPCEGISQEVGSSSKLSSETTCLEVPKDAFVVAVPQRQDLHSDSDEEDFLLDLPEMELLEQGGTVFQPATGALLTASDATFFPFRCWGPTTHLATIGEDEEEDVSNQGAPSMSVMSDMEEESEQKEEDGKVDTNPVLSAESRLDNLLLNSGESNAGPERDEKTPETESKEPESAADESDVAVTSPPLDVDTVMEDSPLTSSASRLPPDGHEFPPNYTEHNPFMVGSPALIELEPEKAPPPISVLDSPPRKLSAEETRSPFRVPPWRKDEKSECSVKDKIAMFSGAGHMPTPRRHFSSSENVFLDSQPPPRPPMPSELLTKKSLSPILDCTHTSLDQNHTTGTCFSTLPRKPVAQEGSVRPSTLTRTSSLHTRSQSMIDIGRGNVEDMRKASLNALIEQRRRGISKLRGLVIPEKVSEVVAPSHTICDLPEIRSRDSILTSKAPAVTSLQRPNTTNRWSTGQTAVNNTSQLVIPSPPWKSSSNTNNLPKYSPAFKRKSLAVYGSTGSHQQEPHTLFPSFRNAVELAVSLESITPPIRSDLSFEYKLPTGKSAPAPGNHSVEDDSDNDSAVSSSRSSISPPPTPPPPPLLSPLHRTLSSETTVSAASSTASTLTCGSSDSNRRVLKAQSVEAINRKNVLSSARYSSGRDLKVGSPLIQRKFEEDMRVAYLNEVEGPASEEQQEEAEKLPEEQPSGKPLPAPRQVPVPPKPMQRKLLEAGPEEDTDLLSVLTGGRGSQMRRQHSKDSVLGDNRRSVSVNDIRKAFEKAEMALANSGRKVNHARVSSLDSTASEDSFTPHYGSVGNLHREQFGSVTSIASSTSLISPQELQLLIDEANQPLEDSVGTMAMPVHDVVVVVLHREGTTGSVGITLAGGADYEAKEITVHKVLAGSPADRDGRIQKGDRILSINGRSMKGVTHRESLNILKAPRSEVVLVVSRSRVPQDGLQLDDCPVATYIPRLSRPPRIPEQPLEAVTSPLVATEGDDRGPPLTITLTKDGAGLGFSLEGGKDSPLGDKPLTIKKIFTGGSAERNGQLCAGDELLNVNGSDVTVLSRIEAWGLMKRLPDGPVALTVRHRLNK